MPLDPEAILNWADSVEDISACRFLIQSKFGMGAEIGRIWKIGLVELAEIPRKDWDDALIAQCSTNRIRYGQFTSAWVQINIRTHARLGIYRTNGRKIVRIETRRLD